MRGVAAFALTVLVVAGGLAGATPPSAVGPDDPDNERPLADAGLDQSVRRGATVLLDATGSRDPDGEIVDYEWSITRPDGTARTPDCVDCPRTRFRPNATGRFAITVTVTDDDGATATDTLYVNVSPGRPPAVTVRGPRTVPIGNAVTYTAAIDGGAAPLSRVVWRVDGRVVASSPIEPDASETTLRTAFPDSGDHRITDLDPADYE